MNNFVVKTAFIAFLFFGCTTTFTQYTYVHEDISVDEWIKSLDAKKGYVFVSGMMNPAMSTNIIRKMMLLDTYDDIERIRIVINTHGGEASSYRSINNAIKMIQKPVDTINVGSCYSAGVALFASATGKRYAFPKTHFMIHKPASDIGIDGVKDAVNYETNMYTDIIKRKSELPAKWFPLSQEMIFFTAEDAKKYKLVDEIITELP